MSEACAQPAVVLLSGGLDSSVLLHHVVRALGRAPVHTLSFDYAQRHRRELDAANWQANAAGVAHMQILDLSFLHGVVQGGTSLVEGGAQVPDFASLRQEELDQPPTYVPNRNMMLLAIAAAYAEAHSIRDVFYGAQAHDEYGYWDCTAEFLERINATLRLNRREVVCVHAPFIGEKKSAVVARGRTLGVDFAHTWSCYRGGAAPCGTCPTCVERATAFREAGVTDPLAGA